MCVSLVPIIPTKIPLTIRSRTYTILPHGLGEEAVCILQTAVGCLYTFDLRRLDKGLGFRVGHVLILGDGAIDRPMNDLNDKRRAVSFQLLSVDKQLERRSRTSGKREKWETMDVNI